MVSFERYTTIKDLNQGEAPRSTQCGTTKSLALVLTFSVLFDLPKMWELETCSVWYRDENTNLTKLQGKLRLQFSELHSNRFYNWFYVIGANNLVHFVIPFISLVYLNVGIFRGVSGYM